MVLPASPGLTYPGFGLAVPRRHFDAWLRDTALDAGAEGLTGRAGAPRFGEDGQLVGFRVERPGNGALEVRGDVVIGADGALSRVGEVAGLVDSRRVLWGFAVRAYVPAPDALPRIWFWEPRPWGGYPGYGWLFPGMEGASNVGLGVGVRGRRDGVAHVTGDLEQFSEELAGAGHLHLAAGRAPSPRLGGWLKMGMVGTTAAAGRTLLVGDAAGLVNPLQGEGIAQALGSARAAAEAVVEAGPREAAGCYLRSLSRLCGRAAGTTTPITAAMLSHPRLVAAAGRVLTAPSIGRMLAGGWAIYWNDLLDGAAPGSARRVASLADHVAGALTAASRDRRTVTRSLAAGPGTGTARGPSAAQRRAEITRSP